MRDSPPMWSLPLVSQPLDAHMLRHGTRSPPSKLEGNSRRKGWRETERVRAAAGAIVGHGEAAVPGGRLLVEEIFVAILPLVTAGTVIACRLLLAEDEVQPDTGDVD